MVIRHDVNPDTYLASEDDYPAVFSILPAAGVATLIDEQWAVTAAHCSYLLLRGNFENQPFEVTINGVKNVVVDAVYPPDCDAIDKARKLFRTARREGRDTTSDSFITAAFSALEKVAGPNDIALLRLEQPVTNTSPLSLYEDDDEVGQAGLMLGWGAFGTGDTGIIQGAEDYDERFRQTRNRISQIRNAMLALDFEHPDAQGILDLEGVNGPGDSGGPLLLATDKGYKVAGVSSYSSYPTQEMDELARKGDLPIQKYGTIEHYTRVSKHLDWLRSVLTARNLP